MPRWKIKKPWRNWRSDDANNETLELVRAAILAASPHNTQPWLFRVGSSSVELCIDTRRNVGALDPYLREEHIGMGCALENLMLAAAVHGYAATVTPVPGKLGPIPAEGTVKLLARVELAAAQAATQQAMPLRPPALAQPVNPDAPLVLLRTSGSTWRPKRVMLTHRSALARRQFRRSLWTR